jgi:hypothetical protein
MWFTLASAQLPAVGANRDLVTKKMTSYEIAEAQRLAKEWKPS